MGLIGPFLLAMWTIANAETGVLPRLFGKSLTLTWQTHATGFGMGGGGRFTRLTEKEMLRVYVSDQGRIFTEKTSFSQPNRVGSSTVARSTEAPDSPDRKVQWRSEGRSLVAYTEFGDGMRRIIVDFDDDHKTCTLKVSFAKSMGSEHIVREGGLVETQPVEVSYPTCRIENGNVFSGG
jgi:hypothetical protein